MKRIKKNSEIVMGDLPRLRQPPPPPRRCSDGSVSSMHSEKRNTSVVGGKAICLKSRTRTYYSRRCKRSLTSIDSLPDELLWGILASFPTDYLYDRARLVCRRWYNIIHSDAFVEQYSSSYGLVLSIWDSPLFYVSVTKQGRIEVSKLRCNRRSQTPAWSGCNGLFLNLSNNHLTPYILNPATKQAFETAPFHSSNRYDRRSCGIAYAAASMVYKLVQPHSHRFKVESHNPYNWQRHVVHYLAILSVGVDNCWRHVRVEHLPDNGAEWISPAPLITEGFMHWVGVQGQRQRLGQGKPCEKVVTLNVETEMISESVVPLPEAHLKSKTLKYYLSTGRCLTLLVGLKDLRWDVWEMRPETGEWRKVEFPCIEFKAETFAQFQGSIYDRDDCFIWPVGWVRYPEVLVFGVRRVDTFIFYNLRTHAIVSSTKLPGICTHYNAFPHRNTLVWLS